MSTPPTCRHGTLNPGFRLVESHSGDWSEEEDVGTSPGEGPEDLESALRQIKALEATLSKAKKDLVDYRQFVTKSLDVEKLTGAVASSSTVDPTVPKRDDDSHYFTSYGSNGTCGRAPHV